MFVLNRGVPDTNKGTSFIEFGPKKETFGANPPDFEVRVKFEETARLLVKKGFIPVNDAAKELFEDKKPVKKEEVAEEATSDTVDESEEKEPRRVLKPRK